MIAAILFDGIATFEEFQKVVVDLLKRDFELEIIKDSDNIQPEFGRWRLIVTKQDGKE